MKHKSSKTIYKGLASDTKIKCIYTLLWFFVNFSVLTPCLLLTLKGCAVLI